MNQSTNLVPQSAGQMPVAGGPAITESPLKEAFQALRNLENVRHENVQNEKKNFEYLQTTFRKMKGLNNEHLPEYVKLQKQIVAYLHTPSYTNYYKVHDKKLTKNTVKRCFVEPFCDKFMKSGVPNLTPGQLEDSSVLLQVELAKFKNQPNVFEDLTATLIELD